MKIKLLIGILIFLIVLNFATLGSYVYYRWVDSPPELPEPPMGHPAPPHRPPRLDNHQRRQLHELRVEFMSKVRPHLNERYQIRQNILQELTKDEVDTAEIYTQLERKAELQREIEREAITMLIQTRQFLSPKQLNFIYKIMDTHNGMTGRRKMGAPPLREKRWENTPDSLHKFNKLNRKEK